MIEKAIHDCLKQMYLVAQPSMDWDEALRNSELGLYEKNPLWVQHYLPKEVADDIINCYAQAYRIPMEWKDNVDTVIDYLEHGGSKDVYIKPSDGSSGHRGYEHVNPLLDELKNITDKDIAEKTYNKCIEHIKYCKDFYEPVLEERRFKTNVLMAAPSYMKDIVKKFWKSQDKDIELKDAKWNDERGKYEFISENN